MSAMKLRNITIYKLSQVPAILANVLPPPNNETKQQIAHIKLLAHSVGTTGLVFIQRQKKPFNFLDFNFFYKSNTRHLKIGCIGSRTQFNSLLFPISISLKRTPPIFSHNLGKLSLQEVYATSLEENSLGILDLKLGR